MTNAPILAKLRADVAAAKDSRTCDDQHSAFRQGCSDCEQNFPDHDARVRLAALPGPALLEAVLFWHENMLIEEHSDLCAFEQSSGADDCDCGGAAIALAAKALVVTDG